ncbi:MAG: AmmeMemoRadiSam system protein B [Candidatus Rokubacteria bacterium]|nr:AmmeMemoRadiSam system protein B [Candidatus Rokubacteria bacterium]
MDSAGFLDSPRFAERRRRIEEGFRLSPVRPPAHAGAAYAGEPGTLQEQIRSFFTHADGPGTPGPVSLGLDGAAGGAPGIRGLIAPHIDFHRGGPTYAWAYRELAHSDADLFVILGTCHAGMADPFAATGKAYETPLGRAAADGDFLDALGRRYGHDLLASEGAHRVEHSVEFQVVMLQHLLGERRPFTIVPLLASFLHEAVWRASAPESDARVPRFLEALGETLAVSGRRVCLVAGVDLAHVGPRFGDPELNTDEFLRHVEAQDRAMLATVTAGDAGAFFEEVARDGDARRICGLSPIYAFLRALPGARGRLLRYSQWPDPEGAVSFCAAAFS